MAKEKLPPLPPLPPLPSTPPPPPPEKKSPRSAKRSKSGSFKHLRGSKDDRLQDFARTGFAGYRRVQVAEKRRTPRAIAALFGLLLLAAAAFGLYRLSQPAELDATAATAGLSPSDPALTSTRIDPELWRRDLESMEALLFAMPSDIGPLGEFGEQFGQETDTFAEQLRADGGAREGALADALDGLAARTDRSNFNIRRLQEVREAWIEIRRQRLGEADWLRTDDAGANRAAELDIYRDAALQIQDLLSETLNTGEELATAGMNAMEREEEWRRTLFFFRDDLKVLRSSLPRRPGVGASAADIEVIHQLDRLFIAAQDLADKNGDVTRLNRRAFDAALDNADEAAAFFDRRLTE